MSINNALKMGPPPRKGPICTIAVALSSLDKAEADALREMLTDPRWGSPYIAELLSSNGHPIANYTVNNHRRGGCACQRRGIS